MGLCVQLTMAGSPKGPASTAGREAFQRAQSEGAIPDLVSDKNGWFTFWDEDNSGELDQEEVTKLCADFESGSTVRELRRQLHESQKSMHDSNDALMSAAKQWFQQQTL